MGRGQADLDLVAFAAAIRAGDRLVTMVVLTLTHLLPLHLLHVTLRTMALSDQVP